MKYLFKELHDRNPDKYMMKVAEELAELSVATLHFHDGKATAEQLIDEMADVYIQLSKLCIFVEQLDVAERIKTKRSALLEKIKATRDV